MDVAISRRRVAVAVLVFLGWAAAAAHAEDAVQPQPAPAGTRTLANTPFQLVLPQGHLFGDWAGSRTWLEEHGITPTLTFVMDALGNPTGGLQQGFRQASNLGLDVRFDLETLFGLAGGSQSPRFLVTRGRRDDARRVFARIGGNADALVRQVEESVRGEHRPRLSDLIVRGTRRFAPVVWIGMGLAAFQQLVGINIIFYYGEVLWKSAGATEQWALRINLLTGLVNILTTIPAIALIDRAGRKPLLVAGSAGMALTLGAMAGVFGTAAMGADGRPLLSHAAAVTGLVAANLYIVAFAISWGPVMWVLLGEMFPNRMRGAALAVSGATNWMMNFAVTVTFLPLLNAVGLAGAYALYAVATLLSLPFVWVLVSETRGKTLEQM